MQIVIRYLDVFYVATQLENTSLRYRSDLTRFKNRLVLLELIFIYIIYIYFYSLVHTYLVPI